MELIIQMSNHSREATLCKKRITILQAEIDHHQKELKAEMAKLQEHEQQLEALFNKNSRAEQDAEDVLALI
jgi:hypothetical protein